MAGEYDKSKYTKKERLQNFWYYSKYYIIVGVLVAVFIVVQVYKAYNQPKYAFTAMFFNTMSMTLNQYDLSDEGKGYVDEFLKSQGLDPEENPADTRQYLNFDIFDGESVEEHEISTMESIGAYISTGDLDVLVANEEFFLYIGYWEAMEDLRNVMDAETLKELEPYLFYVDQELIDELAEYAYDDPEYRQTRPDPRDPSTMKKPIPVGIYLDNANEEFKENFTIQGDVGVVGVFINAPHPDRCIAFIEYILE